MYKFNNGFEGNFAWALVFPHRNRREICHSCSRKSRNSQLNEQNQSNDKKLSWAITNQRRAPVNAIGPLFRKHIQRDGDIKR